MEELYTLYGRMVMGSSVYGLECAFPKNCNGFRV